MTDAEGDVPLYKKMKKVQLLQLEVTKKDTYRIKEEITIPGTKESIAIRLFKDGYIRISTGTEQENKIVFEVLEKFFAKLG